MIDQLIIGDKASFDDFGASLAKSTKKPPKKKSIKETVPFSNITYDFTAINGEIFWNDGELEYVFEMVAESPEKLEEMKTAFETWVMNVIKKDIYDPFIPDYHFSATYEDMSFADDEGMEKTTATVKFSAYPYKIANFPKVNEINIAANSKKTVYIANESSHKITPTITTSRAITLEMEGSEYIMKAGTFKDSALKLRAGTVPVIIKNDSDADCEVIISFYEEVF